MTRIEQFVNEYIGYVTIHDHTLEEQVRLLTEMIKDLMIEDRLRTINILELSGIRIGPKQKGTLLDGVTDGF
jgi:hypothetical protein